MAKYKSQLTNGFTLLKVKRKAKTAEDLLPEEVRTPMPKYGRVNELLSTKIEIEQNLTKSGFKILNCKPDEFKETAMNLEEKEALWDPIMDGLIAFNSKVNLSDLKVNKENKLTIQVLVIQLIEEAVIFQISSSFLVLSCVCFSTMPFNSIR